MARSSIQFQKGLSLPSELVWFFWTGPIVNL